MSERIANIKTKEIQQFADIFYIGIHDVARNNNDSVIDSKLVEFDKRFVEMRFKCEERLFEMRIFTVGKTDDGGMMLRFVSEWVCESDQMNPGAPFQSNALYELPYPKNGFTDLLRKVIQDAIEPKSE